MRGIRRVSGVDWALSFLFFVASYLGRIRADRGFGSIGSDGAPAKKGMSRALDDAKKKAAELMGKGS